MPSHTVHDRVQGRNIVQQIQLATHRQCHHGTALCLRNKANCWRAISCWLDSAPWMSATPVPLVKEPLLSLDSVTLPSKNLVNLFLLQKRPRMPTEKKQFQHRWSSREQIWRVPTTSHFHNQGTQSFRWYKYNYNDKARVPPNVHSPTRPTMKEPTRRGAA